MVTHTGEGRLSLKYHGDLRHSLGGQVASWEILENCKKVLRHREYRHEVMLFEMEVLSSLELRNSGLRPSPQFAPIDQE